MRASFLTLLLSLTFGLVPTFAQEHIPPLKACSDLSVTSSCQKEGLYALKKEVVETAFNSLGYALNDSIFFEFNLTDKGVSVYNSYAYFSPQCAEVMQGIFEDLAADLFQPGGHSDQVYSISFSPSLDESFEDYVHINRAHRMPVVKDCRSFNNEGKKGCLRYMLFLMEDILAQRGATEQQGEFTFFIEGNELKAVTPKLPFLDAEFHSAFKPNLDSILKQYIVSGFGKKSKKVIIDYEFQLHSTHSDEDSIAYFNYRLERLKSMAHPYAKQVFIDELFSIADRYYKPKSPQWGDLLWQHLKLLELDSSDVITVEGESVDLQKLFNPKEKSNKEDAPSYAVVEKVPVFEGCDSQDNNEALKKCLQLNIIKYVSRNFKFPSDARKNKIGGKVYVNFAFEKDGSISNIEIIRGVHPSLDFETIRVASKMPYLVQPATQRGKPVRMSFTLPINAKVQ
jgi:TonB family protein